MTPNYRPGRADDSPAIFSVFFRALIDLGQRSGHIPRDGPDAPPPVEKAWPRRKPIFDHLAASADEFWVAEVDGEVVGYGRSIVRDRVQQLTEFFVAPSHQSQGIGAELFRRAFPERGARQRLIIATGDPRALPRYLRAGLSPSSPVGYLYGPPQDRPVATDLTFAPIEPGDHAGLEAVDRAVLGFVRPQDHAWLQSDRNGFVARRDGAVVGYGYHGASPGPFAALSETDLPALLAFAEARAVGAQEEFGVELPLANRQAVAHLLGRGFRMSPFLAYFLSDGPGVKLSNYVFLAPPFFT